SHVYELYSLFFCSALHHRYLLSSPPRRSSDLAARLSSAAGAPLRCVLPLGLPSPLVGSSHVDLITQFPLGDDLAWTLLTLGALAVAALVAGAVVPSRMRRDEDSEELDEDLGRRLGGQLLSAGSIMLWVGLPLAVLVYLAPGTTDDRLLRSGLLLAGIALGPLAAWRGIAVQLAALGLDAERRPAMIARLGALTVTGALGLAALPVVLVVWFLQAAAGPALIALAAGAAVSALAIRICAAPVEAAAASSALLVGADEHELDAED